MKIKFQTSYYVGYLPTPRCRKLRYKEEKEYLSKTGLEHTHFYKWAMNSPRLL